MLYQLGHRAWCANLCLFQHTAGTSENTFLEKFDLVLQRVSLRNFLFYLQNDGAELFLLVRRSEFDLDT